MEEAETSDMGQFGKYVYVSCWTADSQESISLWNMYTPDMTGVRIKLCEYPFKKHIYKKGQFSMKTDIESYIDYEQLYRENKVSITPGQPVLIEVQYTEENAKVCPKIKTASQHDAVEKFLSAKAMDDLKGINLNISYSFTELGQFKRTCWKFQKECRYLITVSPMGLREKNPPSFKKQQEEIRRIEDKSSQSPLRRMFLEIDDDAFSSMEITLGPKVNEGCRIIVESLVNQYNPHCTIRNSSLKIK